MAFAPKAARAAVLEDTVATVNGQPILLSEYQKEVEAMLGHWKRNAPALINDKAAVVELKRKVLDQMVDHLLLTQDAEKRKIKIHDREIDNGIMEVKENNFRRDENGKALTDDEMDSALTAELKKEGVNREQFRERIRKQLMMRKVIDEVVRPKVKPPEEAAVKSAFEKIKFIVKGDTSAVAGLSEDETQAFLALGQRVKDFSSERVRVAHLLIKVPPKASILDKTQALKKAKEFKDRVDKGDDFSEVARKNSEDTESAARGGDLGFILRGYMPPEFEKVAFATGVGDVSEPVETEFGYHLIRVVEKKAAESVTYEKIKDELMQFLFQMRSQIELEQFVKTLRSQSHVEEKLPKESAEAKDKPKEN